MVVICLCLCLDFQRVSKFPKDFDEPGDFRLGKIRILLDLNRLAQSGEWRRPVSLRSCVNGVNRAGPHASSQYILSTSLVPHLDVGTIHGL